MDRYVSEIIRLNQKEMRNHQPSILAYPTTIIFQLALPLYSDLNGISELVNYSQANSIHYLIGPLVDCWHVG